MIPSARFAARIARHNADAAAARATRLSRTAGAVAWCRPRAYCAASFDPQNFPGASARVRSAGEVGEGEAVKVAWHWPSLSTSCTSRTNSSHQLIAPRSLVQEVLSQCQCLARCDERGALVQEVPGDLHGLRLRQPPQAPREFLVHQENPCGRVRRPCGRVRRPCEETRRAPQERRASCLARDPEAGPRQSVYMFLVSNLAGPVGSTMVGLTTSPASTQPAVFARSLAP